jgi:hypothetical protein
VRAVAGANGAARRVERAIPVLFELIRVGEIVADRVVSTVGHELPQA